MRAEILGGCDEAAPKELLPNAVDRDAGGERVALRGDPFGEAQPGGFRRVADLRQNCRRRRADFQARSAVVAAHGDMRRDGFVALDHGVGEGALGQGGNELGERLAGFLDAVFDGLVFLEVRTAAAEEPIRDLVALDCSERVRRRAHQPVGAVVGGPPFGDGVVPVGAGARIVHRFDDPRSPLGLKRRDAVLCEEAFPFGAVGGVSAQVGAELARQGRLDVAFHRVVEEGEKLVELFL